MNRNKHSIIYIGDHTRQNHALARSGIPPNDHAKWSLRDVAVGGLFELEILGVRWSCDLERHLYINLRVQ